MLFRSPVQAALYRMVTEALVNAGRHAPGATVRMTLEPVPAGVRLEIEDDGGGTGSDSSVSGVSCATASVLGRGVGTGTGTGIPSMLARAEQLGGHASAGPQGSGWAVEAVLPDTPLARDAALEHPTESPPPMTFPANTASTGSGGTQA